jgi:hypothetical protein
MAKRIKITMLSEILAGVIGIESRLREQARGPLMAEHTRRELDLLRAERVKLQGENEALSHDLEKVQTELDEAQRSISWYKAKKWLDENVEGADVDLVADLKGPSETEALAERLARLEDRTTDRYADLHRRIGAVVDIIGNSVSASEDKWAGVTGSIKKDVRRIEALVGNSTKGWGTMVEHIDALRTRLTTLEALATQRGERLDDLERRQDQDDADRATGEGMAEPPPRDDLPGTGMDPEPSQVPTHVNGLHAGGTPDRATFGPGDDIRLEGAVSEGGHNLKGGWYSCSGIAALSNWPVQVKEITAIGDPRPAVFWTKPEYVVEVRHAQR